jgi:hypothetical protein
MELSCSLFGSVVGAILVWALIVPVLLLVAIVKSGPITLEVVAWAVGTIVLARDISLLLSASLLRSISRSKSALIVKASVVILVGVTSDLKFWCLCSVKGMIRLTEF